MNYLRWREQHAWRRLSARVGTHLNKGLCRLGGPIGDTPRTATEDTVDAAVLMEECVDTRRVAALRLPSRGLAEGGRGGTPDPPVPLKGVRDVAPCTSESSISSSPPFSLSMLLERSRCNEVGWGKTEGGSTVQVRACD